MVSSPAPPDGVGAGAGDESLPLPPSMMLSTVLARAVDGVVVVAGDDEPRSVIGDRSLPAPPVMMSRPAPDDGVGAAPPFRCRCRRRW
jgi:hypothetical protein